MPALNFTVDGFRYRADPMSVKTQVEIVCKTSPLVAAGIGQIVPFFLDMRDKIAAITSPTATPEERAQALLSFMMDDGSKKIGDLLVPVAKQLAAMDQDDVWNVMRACLSLCQRTPTGVQVDTWMPVWVGPPHDRPLGDDLSNDLFQMLKVVFPVFHGNLIGFFGARLFSSIGEAQKNQTGNQ